MAPEMIDRKDYGNEVDWWALGTLLYEMLAGTAPFVCENNNKNDLYNRIRSGKIKFPRYFTSEAVAVIKGLLQRDAAARLKVYQVKTHAFFKSTHWKKMLNLEVPPPFRPKIADDNDVSNFDNSYVCMFCF